MAVLRATLALLAAQCAVADYVVTKTYADASCSGAEMYGFVTDASMYGCAAAVASGQIFTCSRDVSSGNYQTQACFSGAFTAPTGTVVTQVFTASTSCQGTPNVLQYFPSTGCISSSTSSSSSVKRTCSAGVATQVMYTSSTCSGAVYTSVADATGCTVGSSQASITFCTSASNPGTFGSSSSSAGPTTTQASVALSNVNTDVLSATNVYTFASAINSQLALIPYVTVKVVGIFDASNSQRYYYRRELATTTATLVVAITGTGLTSTDITTGLPTYIRAAITTAYPTGGIVTGSATIVCTSSCSSSSVSSSYYSSGSLVFGTDDSDANKLTSSGVAASVIIAGVLAAVVLICVLNGPKGDADPAAAEHKGRAASAWSIIYAGVVFQVFGILAGLAAPAIPWIYGSATASYGSTSAGGYYIFTAVAYTLKACYSGSCVSSTYPLGLYAVGAAINYVGMFFLAIGFIIASCAARRVRGVAVAGILPPRTTCCCAASLPAINGLSWCGLLVQLAGAIFMWTIFGISASGAQRLDRPDLTPGPLTRIPPSRTLNSRHRPRHPAPGGLQVPRRVRRL